MLTFVLPVDLQMTGLPGKQNSDPAVSVVAILIIPSVIALV